LLFILSALAVLGASAVAAFAIARGRSGVAPGPIHSACATSTSSFIHARDLGQFTQIVDQRSNSIAMQHGTTSLTQSFIESRLMGYLANVAINGPDRASEDAAARKKGYSPGAIPLVPLSGPVVAHNPGLLETYQTNSVFRSASAARTWLEHHLSPTYLDKPLSIPLGDESIAFARTLGPDDGSNEHELAVNVLIGNVVIELTYQGGAQITVDQAKSIAVMASTRVRTCA
jgi:hypothetical protein